MEFTSVFYKNAGSKTRYTINQGGTSSSKTWSILQLLYLKAEKHQGIHISIVAESLPVLKRGVIRDFLLMLKQENLYDENCHNMTDNIYNVGLSKIEFFSTDDASKVRGSRRDILYCNEVNNITYDMFTELQIRTKQQIYVDYNPTSSFFIHDKVLTLPSSEITYIQSTYKDNELLDNNIKKAIELKITDQEWFKVYGLGEIGSSEGIVFTNWRLCDELPKDFQWCLYGIDWGFTHDPSTCIKVVMSQGELWCEELMYETGLTNSDIIIQLNPYKKNEFIGDSAEPKSIEDLRRAGFNIQGAAKGPDSIRNGIDSVKKYKLNITKGSTNLIKELRNYQWKRTRDGNWDSKPIDNFNHLIDPLRYICLSRESKSGNEVQSFSFNY